MAKRGRLKNILGWVLMLVLTAILGYALIDGSGGDNRRMQQAVDAARRDTESDVDGAKDATSGILELDGMVRRIRQSAPAPLTRTGEVPEITRPPAEFNSDARPALKIECSVRHRWQVKSLDLAVTHIVSCLDAVGITSGSSRLARLRGALELDVTLSCAELVQLVRLLDASGYVFHSWQPPYPENNLFRNQPQERVRYQATFECGRWVEQNQ